MKERKNKNLIIKFRCVFCGKEYKTIKGCNNCEQKHEKQSCAHLRRHL
jgi:hypothetical protein